MKLDEILDSLFPQGHTINRSAAILTGHGKTHAREYAILGVVDGAYIGVEDALMLAEHVISTMRLFPSQPILFLLDSSSQRMSRRDELLGLYEYLGHLAKALTLASQTGHRTFGLLYGGTAAGAFIATALATERLFIIPGANPSVMDLPSMAKVTKLPLSVLEEKALATPVFAPGAVNLASVGGIASSWDVDNPLADQLEHAYSQVGDGDTRAALGETRGGRPLANSVANEVLARARSKAP